MFTHKEEQDREDNGSKGNHKRQIVQMQDGVARPWRKTGWRTWGVQGRGWGCVPKPPVSDVEGFGLTDNERRQSTFSSVVWK